MVKAIKNLQAPYNVDANKIVEHAKQEKATKEILNFPIDLATVAMIAEDTSLQKESSTKLGSKT